MVITKKQNLHRTINLWGVLEKVQKYKLMTENHDQTTKIRKKTEIATSVFVKLKTIVQQRRVNRI